MMQPYRLAFASVYLSGMVAFASLAVGVFGLVSDGIATTLLLWSTVAYIASLISYLYLWDRMPKKHEEI